MLLENEAFLTELCRLFHSTRTSGSLKITMKRYDGRTKPDPRPSKAVEKPIPRPAEYKCLLRAKAGNRKIATVVNAKDVNRFQLAYSTLIKGNVDGLKKWDKKTVKRSSKAKATQ